MMLRWTDTTAETQGDMEREQEMTHITEDDRKWATDDYSKMYKTWGLWLHSNYFILYALFLFFFFHMIHRIKKMPWKGGVV